jgi:hypothetical protein
MKKLVNNLLFIILLFVLFSQLSPVLVTGCGGIAGTFGIRPISQDCIGALIKVDTAIKIFPKGDIEFKLIFFHFRYYMPSELEDPICVGQDIVYFWE